MQYQVAVRTLCEFTAKRGDLDLRFTPTPSAQEGIAGHLLVRERRGADYETEISLKGAFGELAVRGRADGYDPGRHRLEEIKTHRGDLAKQAANQRHLHWAQARVYGWLFCQARGCAELELALVYFDLGTQQETVFTEHHAAESLREFFETSCAAFLAWAQQEAAHRTDRDTALAALAFPYPEFRTGQRALAESVYKGAASGRCLLAQAPTGIGKTVGTLFAQLKATPPHGLDKIFYLTAKSTGRQLALDASSLIGESAPALRLRVLELSARDKACEHRDKACHGESCPLACGFYDRLPAARAQALEQPSMDSAALRKVARERQVCPYFLAQELVRWADVVVGDYNYFFDGSALLYMATLQQEWRVGVLADEAHNLVERAREMYSSTLSETSLRAARSVAPVAMRKALEKASRGFTLVRKALAQDDSRLDALPDGFATALKQACVALEEQFAQAAPGAVDATLQQAYFDLLGFVRLAEAFGDHSTVEVSEEAGNGRRRSLAVRIQNLVPAPFLKQRFASAHSVTLFSATLNPPHYHRDLLGMPANTAWIDVESPFDPEQLRVHVVSSISTRYAHRQRSVLPIADLIAQQFAGTPGNYLAFFSSFEYLELVASEFQRRHAEVPVWTQARGMDEGERSRFLERFVPGGAGVGFAVLGGSFGEGIDLRGDRLVGAFVATLGLPQVNARNEKLKAHLDAVFGDGYEYTYLYPGLQKVVQAAGRVIRTRDDRGVVFLIDDRYTRRAVRELLPSWWQVEHGAASASSA